jgi:hypothetical protein
MLAFLNQIWLYVPIDKGGKAAYVWHNWRPFSLFNLLFMPYEV